MAETLLYNVHPQNYPFCSLELSVETQLNESQLKFKGGGGRGLMQPSRNQCINGT